MAKKKYYVVWQGRQPGIYENWEDCLAQVHKASGARYKAFESKAEAQAAYDKGKKKVAQDAPPKTAAASSRGAATKVSPRKKGSSKGELQNPPDYRNDTVLPLPMEVPATAIAVDAACSGNPGMMEYRGVDLATGAEVFHFGPLFGTNNIGEFLAIVHALAWMKQTGQHRIIYSDSRNAMLWVKKRKCKTTLAPSARSAAVLEMVRRGEEWLTAHGVNQEIRKWDTKQWGEIPADFGRK